MRIAVMADAMALSEGPPGDFRMGRHISPQQEECRAHAFIFESVQNLRRGAGPGAIVEREDQFLGAQRQRRGELLAADARRALGVDLDCPCGPERIRIAGA